MLTSSNQSQERPANQQNSPNPYEPRRNIKESYLLLRNNGGAFAKLQLPGLFDYRSGHDRLLFVIGFLLEMLATCAIWYFAKTRYSASIIGILGGLLFVIIIDYFACGIHQYVVIKRRTIINNKRLLMVPPISPLRNHNIGYTAYINALDAMNPDPKLWDYLFIIIVWGLVFFRIIAFISLAMGSSLFYFYTKQSGAMAYSGLVLICLFYVGIAWIHTHHTGYALASIWHNILKKIDSTKFFKNIFKTGLLEPTVIEKNIDLNTFVEQLRNDPDPICQALISYNPNRLSQDIATGFKTDTMILGGTNNIHTPHHPHRILAEANKPECCIIKTIGFLDDEHLYRMVRAQTTDIAKYAIALYGVAIQLELLETEIRPENN